MVIALIARSALLIWTSKGLRDGLLSHSLAGDCEQHEAIPTLGYFTSCLRAHYAKIR